MVRWFLLFVFFVPALPAFAQGVPDIAPSYAESDSGSILMTPAGTGPRLSWRGLTVTVHVIDGNGVGIAGYPFQDCYLGDVNYRDLNTCIGANLADGNSDAQGIMTISGTLAGGGSTIDGMQVYLGGQDLLSPPLQIRVNSPDFNADRVVDVSDVGVFASDFGSGVYRFRSDLVHDGVNDILDVGRFAQAVQETCP